MDTPEHVSLYIQGLEMRRKVVGEDYVENALEKGKSDFLRPLQQFATVRSPGLPSFHFVLYSLLLFFDLNFDGFMGSFRLLKFFAFRVVCRH